MTRLFIIALTLTALWSCGNDRYAYRPVPRPGVCLSFDDYAIDGWFSLRPLFQKYGVKATFFVTRFDSLTQTQVEKLKILQQDGHEIGFHGTVHVLSEYYLKDRSLAEYIGYEILPGLRSMNQAGLSPSSFAYPYSAKYSGTDKELLKYFHVVRSSLPLNGSQLSKVDGVFYSFDGSRLVYAMSIDTKQRVTTEMLEEALERCQKQDEVLLLHTHEPGLDVTEAELEQLFQLIEKRQLNYFCTRELVR